MDNLIPWSGFYSLATIALLLCAWNAATPESIRYNPVSCDVIEARLHKYQGNDEQREAALSEMFNLIRSGHDERNGETPSIQPAQSWSAKMLETAKDSCCSILYSLGFLVELVVRSQTKHLTENNSASTKACPTQPCDRVPYRVVWCRGDHNLPSQTWVQPSLGMDKQE